MQTFFCIINLLQECQTSLVGHIASSTKKLLSLKTMTQAKKLKAGKAIVSPTTRTLQSQAGKKIHKFVEKLIYDNCQVKKDIYGED